MPRMFESIEEMVESRNYLLEFQRKQLIEDLECIEIETKSMEQAVDAIFYKLFGRGWHDLSTEEQSMIRIAWNG